MTVSEALYVAFMHLDVKTLNHSIRVANYTKENGAIPESLRENCYALALMHDVVENSENFNIDELPSSEFKIALRLLTHCKDDSYREYCRDLHPDAYSTRYDIGEVMAYFVKLADMKDHLNLKLTLTDSLKEKYLEGLAELL